MVVIEYNATLGKENSLAMRYDPEFIWKDKTPPLYFGASLKALVELGKSRGYSLVACESTGANAFFILNELTKKVAKIPQIPEASIEDAFYHRPSWPKRLSEERQQEIIAALDFVEV